MDIKLLKDVVAVFENSSLSTMELEAENIKIKLGREAYPTLPQPAAQPVIQADTPAAQTPKGEYVKSPLVGTFYAAPSRDSRPFVKEGDRVKTGDVLCIIEAMKVMNEIKAPRDGVITHIKVANGRMVQYDEEIMAIGDEI